MDKADDDVIFVGVLRPPHAELLLLLAQQVLSEILEINNALPASVNAGLRTRVFESENMNGQTDRRICISDYVDGGELMVLPCQHSFHSSCVQHWLRQNTTCPVCRTGIN